MSYIHLFTFCLVCLVQVGAKIRYNIRLNYFWVYIYLLVLKMHNANVTENLHNR